MPTFCCVVGCGSRGDRDTLSFFRLPEIRTFKHATEVNELTKERREKWLAAIKRADWTPTKLKYARVCSKHFFSGKPANLKEKDDPDWVPSLVMGYNFGSYLKICLSKKRLNSVDSISAASKSEDKDADSNCAATDMSRPIV